MWKSSGQFTNTVNLQLTTSWRKFIFLFLLSCVISIGWDILDMWDCGQLWYKWRMVLHSLQKMSYKRFFCKKCNYYTVSGSMRYKLKIFVADDYGSSTFLLWDKEWLQVLGKHVVELITANSELYFETCAKYFLN